MSDGQMVRAVDLAMRLDLSRARISQMVKDGKLAGCYSGDGRSRLFDIGRVAELLGKRLDNGQLLGNGSETKRRLSELDKTTRQPEGLTPDAPLPKEDPDRYELARIEKAEQEARRMRLANEQAEGTVVLASEVDRQVARALSMEVSQFETFMKEAVAEIFESAEEGKAVRMKLLALWRTHRSERSQASQQAVLEVEMSDAERAADI